MNQEKLIYELQALLAGFLFAPRFLAELLELIQGSGYEKQFLTCFRIRLRLLLADPVHIFQRHEDFEHIEGGIYSMRLIGNGFNVRVLYAISSEGAPILLLPFYERRGKHATSYENYLETAKSRKREME